MTQSLSLFARPFLAPLNSNNQLSMQEKQGNYLGSATSVSPRRLFTFAQTGPLPNSPRETSFQEMLVSQQFHIFAAKPKIGGSCAVKKQAFSYLGFTKVSLVDEESVDYGSDCDNEVAFCNKRPEIKGESSSQQEHVKNGKIEAAKDSSGKAESPVKKHTKSTMDTTQMRKWDVSRTNFGPVSFFKTQNEAQGEDTRWNQQRFVIFERQSTKKRIENGPTSIQESGASKCAEQSQAALESNANLLPSSRLVTFDERAKTASPAPRTQSKERSRSRSRSRSQMSLLDRKLNQHDKKAYLRNTAQNAANRTSKTRSKVAIMLSTPEYFKAVMAHKRADRSQDKSGQIKLSYVSKQSEKLLTNRPKMNIADLLIQKGQLQGYRREKMVRNSLPSFHPKINVSPDIKRQLDQRGTVFDRLSSSSVNYLRPAHAEPKHHSKPPAKIPSAANKTLKQDISKFLEYERQVSLGTPNSCNIHLRKDGSHAEFVLGTIDRQPTSKPDITKSIEACLTLRAQERAGQVAEPDQQPSPLPFEKKVAATTCQSFKQELNGCVQQAVSSKTANDFYQRSRFWLLRKEGKLAQQRRELEDKDLVGCTFKPHTTQGKTPPNPKPKNSRITQKENETPTYHFKSPDSYIEEIMRSAGLLVTKGK